MKAAIHGSGSTPRMLHQTPSTKVSDAQKVSFTSSLDCSVINVRKSTYFAAVLWSLHFIIGRLQR